MHCDWHPFLIIQNWWNIWKAKALSRQRNKNNTFFHSLSGLLILKQNG
jgi:hypothetical protein